jgi:hypothetical protein
MANETPAGWYPDPQDGIQNRYWDGSQWTGHTVPRDPTAAPAAPTSAFPVPLAGPSIGMPDESALGKATGSGFLGWVQRQKAWSTVTAAVVVIVIVIVGVGISQGGKSSNTPTTSTMQKTGATSRAPSGDKATTTAPSANGSSFRDGLLATPDVRIVITKHKIIPVGGKGNEYGSKPVIAFWYKVTNVSGRKTDADMEFITDFSAYQDNNPNRENPLDIGALPDERFSDTQMDEIKKGGTVENAVSYELDDLRTPVELVASDDFGLTRLGQATYDLE